MNLEDQVKEKIENILNRTEMNKPTCLIFECVLVYMDLEKSSKILTYFTSLFPQVYSISYEQVNLEDRFGQVMLNNLISRGCGLNGYEACISLESQKQRFLKCGFIEASCQEMDKIYHYLCGRQEIEKLEFLDDVEIFKQLLQHYSITTASNNSCFDGIVYA